MVISRLKDLFNFFWHFVSYRAYAIIYLIVESIELC